MTCVQQLLISAIILHSQTMRSRPPRQARRLPQRYRASGSSSFSSSEGRTGVWSSWKNLLEKNRPIETRARSSTGGCRLSFGEWRWGIRRGTLGRKRLCDCRHLKLLFTGWAEDGSTSIGVVSANSRLAMRTFDSDHDYSFPYVEKTQTKVSMATVTCGAGSSSSNLVSVQPRNERSVETKAAFDTPTKGHSRTAPGPTPHLGAWVQALHL